MFHTQELIMQNSWLLKGERTLELLIGLCEDFKKLTKFRTADYFTNTGGLSVNTVAEGKF